MPSGLCRRNRLTDGTQGLDMCDLEYLCPGGRRVGVLFDCRQTVHHLFVQSRYDTKRAELT
jgi:hypothetical protein